MRRQVAIQKTGNKKKRMNYRSKLNVIGKNITEILKMWGFTPIEIIDDKFTDPQLIIQMYYGRGIRQFQYLFSNYIQHLEEGDLNKLKRNMDWRTPYDYYRNMVLGWVLEAGFIKWLRSKGIPVVEHDGSGGKKVLFDPKHMAKLDLNIGNAYYLEVQHTLRNLNDDKIELYFKYWKLRKFRKPNTYLIVFFLNEKKVAIIHVFDYLRSIEKVENYYANGKDGFRLIIDYSKKREDFPHYCICDVDKADKFLLNLFKMHLLANNKRRGQKRKIEPIKVPL